MAYYTVLFFFWKFARTIRYRSDKHDQSSSEVSISFSFLFNNIYLRGFPRNVYLCFLLVLFRIYRTKTDLQSNFDLDQSYISSNNKGWQNVAIGKCNGTFSANNAKFKQYMGLHNYSSSLRPSRVSQKMKIHTNDPTLMPF